VATLLRTALRPAAAQDQVQVLAVWCDFGDWVLRYDAAVVFTSHRGLWNLRFPSSGFSQSDLIEADDRCHRACV
jgi:hypothetical protein